MNKLPQSRQFDIVVQDLQSEVLIYDLRTNKAFCLNETSSMIWQLCEGKYSVKQISQSISQKLNKPITEDLVWLALDQFKRDGLLENNNAFEINFSGLNRRQVIKKIGFASLVALPVISSIVVPNAAMAASGLAAVCASCTSNSQCVNNNCLNSRCSIGTTNSLTPNTLLGVGFSETFNSCQTFAASCCSGAVDWYVTGNCRCKAVTV